MRTIKYTNRFRRDYKRERAGQHGKTLDADLAQVVDMLKADTPLPRRYFDHPLSGEWKDCRDCHVKPDLVLIYQKPDKIQPGACAAWLAQRAGVVNVCSFARADWPNT